MLLLPILFVISSIAASEVQVNEFASGESIFASDFYQQCIQSNSGNLVVSPLSVAIAFTLLAQGSNGNTLKQLKNGLHLSGSKCKIAKQYFNYNQLLNTSAGNVTLSVGNGIFVNEGFELNPHFENVAVQKFSSLVESVDFTKSTESAQIINSYVEKKTHDKIKNLISPDSLNGDTRVVLVNAIYMKAKWQYEFKKSNTRKDVFYSNGEEENSIEFMHMTKSLSYGNLDELDASALGMNYLKSDFALIILLPNTYTGLSALEDKLNGYDWTKITDQMRQQQVDVTIPKFKVESKISLKEIIQELGMGEIFEIGEANLTGILKETPNGSEPLYVSDAIHQGFIEVDEGGTEAAAATAITVATLSAIIPSEDPQIFKADHPFVYYILDKKTKTIIFSGRITQLE